MTTNTTDHLASLRQQIADVEQQHQSHYGSHVGEPKHTYCGLCQGAWPCDASTLARQMTTLLDGLEDFATDEPIAADEPAARRVIYAYRAQAQHVIAAAQEQEDSYDR